MGTLSERLGLETVVDERVDLSRRPGYFRPGRKVATLVYAMVARADCIDDADVLRSGATGAVLPHGVMAPSTLGTFLRSFTFGHVRQLDRGAAFGYTKVRVLHPLLAARADTGEVLHLGMRKGSANTGRGAVRFVREVIGRVRRAGSSGPLTLRADSGFWSKHVVKACRDHGVGYSIIVNQNKWVKRIENIEADTWEDIDYTLGGVAQVTEIPSGDNHHLVVRRTRFTSAQVDRGHHRASRCPYRAGGLRS